MTFELVRIGWPNTAAILALAIMPVVALTAAADRHPVAAHMEQAEAATICRTAAECPVVAGVIFAPEAVLE